MELRNIKSKIISDLKEFIPELANQNYNFSLNKFRSKQNLVFNLEFNKKPENYPKEFVIKIFQTEKSDGEFNTLKKLEKQDLLVPKVLLYEKPYLILEKVNGINMCDFINENLSDKKKLDELDEETFDKIILCINMLAKWIADLHKNNIVKKVEFSVVTVLNKGDTRLKDFIIDFPNETIFGVDFEDTYEGNHLDDLAWICCSLLDTDPGIFEIPSAPEHKSEMINQFLKRYYKFNDDFPFSFDYFANKLIENLNIVIERRDLDMTLSKETILGNISKKV